MLNDAEDSLSPGVQARPSAGAAPGYNDAGDAIDPGTESLAGKESFSKGSFNDDFDFECGKSEVNGTDKTTAAGFGNGTDVIDAGHISG